MGVVLGRGKNRYEDPGDGENHSKGANVRSSNGSLPSAPAPVKTILYTPPAPKEPATHLDPEQSEVEEQFKQACNLNGGGEHGSQNGVKVMIQRTTGGSGGWIPSVKQDASPPQEQLQDASTLPRRRSQQSQSLQAGADEDDRLEREAAENGAAQTNPYLVCWGTSSNLHQKLKHLHDANTTFYSLADVRDTFEVPKRMSIISGMSMAHSEEGNFALAYGFTLNETQAEKALPGLNQRAEVIAARRENTVAVPTPKRPVWDLFLYIEWNAGLQWRITLKEPNTDFVYKQKGMMTLKPIELHTRLIGLEQKASKIADPTHFSSRIFVEKVFNSTPGREIKVKRKPKPAKPSVIMEDGDEGMLS
eukprot:gnl/TRDRNA2_/TRDRNA2_195752_c0_seq1.p1 gnl/TRDRNA2_/TRDRNA2_195752_c0~~gnl/TRDRNA2_/TRDRNA2_195752_c0_seq1.p1  ORF type:complete len:362 (-),score=64.22 gnl/TRDRNA2_/TRDRNA2_195752_c0_seq1:84-1169(-)